MHDATDDLVCARWCTANIAAGMSPLFAGQCSDGLLKAMRAHPEAHEFEVWCITDRATATGELRFVTEAPEEPAELVFTVPVARWRADIQREWGRPRHGTH